MRRSTTALCQLVSPGAGVGISLTHNVKSRAMRRATQGLLRSPPSHWHQMIADAVLPGLSAEQRRRLPFWLQTFGWFALGGGAVTMWVAGREAFNYSPTVDSVRVSQGVRSGSLHEVAVDGRKVYYSVHGSCGPLVVVNAGTISMSKHLVEELSQHARVVTFDRSYVHDRLQTLPDGADPVEVSREELLAVLKDLKPENKVTLVSMNHQWLSTMRTALRNSDKVANLVLIDPYTSAQGTDERAQHLSTGGKPGQQQTLPETIVPVDLLVDPLLGLFKPLLGNSLSQSFSSSANPVWHGVGANEILRERVVRDVVLGNATSTRPHLLQLLPLFLHSIVPTLARMGPADTRTSSVEAELDAVAAAAAPGSDSDAAAALQGVEDELRSLLCQPFNTFVLHTRLPEERTVEKRWNCDSLTFTMPSEPEIGLREVLQEYSDRALEVWRSALPGRCQQVPSATADSKLEVYEPDASVLSQRIRRMLAVEE